MLSESDNSWCDSAVIGQGMRDVTDLLCAGLQPGRTAAHVSDNLLKMPKIA